MFLTDRHAYKLKKAVRLEFLDFSTPALRHRACLQELSLNQRFAPGVYLDVLPIVRRSSGLITLGGPGKNIDWVVKMRRLPSEDALDVILRERRLTAANADDIATNLAHFYSGLDAAPLAAHEYSHLLERHARANVSTLLDALPNDCSRLHRIQSAQLRFLNVEAELIADRVGAGRIVDGHGDLRPEHIYLDSPLSIIDCVEFSDELRTVDIADELSFLAMECQRLGELGFGKIVLDRYEQLSGDEIPARLLAFYRSYRACVRAKVAILRGRQQTATEQQVSEDLARQYIYWADRSSADLGPPCLLMVGGLMGSGKSTLASAIASALDATLLATDRIRRKLLGISKRPARYGEDHYRPELRDRVYEELLGEASDLLSERQSVVLDGTFLTKMLREQTYALCRRHSAKCLHIQTTCPKSTAFARIQRRAKTAESESEARAELYDQQAEKLEPLSAGEPAITLDTTQPMSHQLHTVFRKLRGSLFQGA